MPAVEPAEPQLPPFDHTPAPYRGPSKEEVHALRKQFLSPGVGRLASLEGHGRALGKEGPVAMILGH